MIPDRNGPALRQFVLRLAVASLVVELLLSAAWLRLARQASLPDLLLQQPNPGLSLAAGLCTGIVVAIASRAYFSGLARDVARDLFVPIFRGVTYREVLLLSLLPALGEEILFRGTIQPEIGLLPTSLVFGLLHSGFSRKLLPYGLWATLVGALLGTLFLWTGSLWGPIAAHALTNGAGLLWVKRLAAEHSSRP